MIEDLQDEARSCQAARALENFLRQQQFRAALQVPLQRPFRGVGERAANRGAKRRIALAGDQKEPDVLKRPAGATPIEKRLPHSGRETDSPGPGADGPTLERGDQSSLRPSEDASPVQQASLSVPINPSGNSRQVASIAINRELTGGIAAAGGPGDDGLLVVVAPRDRRGRPVAAPADMSVAVFDPAVRDEEGLAVLVGRWDFTAAETGSLFRRTGSVTARST